MNLTPSLLRSYITCTAAYLARSLCQERARQVQCEDCKLANQRPWRAQRLRTRGSHQRPTYVPGQELMRGRNGFQDPSTRKGLTPIGTMSTRNQLCRPPPRTEPIKKAAAVIPAAFPATAEMAQTSRSYQPHCAVCAACIDKLSSVPLLGRRHICAEYADATKKAVQLHDSPRLARLFSRRKYTDAPVARASCRPGTPWSASPGIFAGAVNACRHAWAAQRTVYCLLTSVNDT